MLIEILLIIFSIIFLIDIGFWIYFYVVQHGNTKHENPDINLSLYNENLRAIYFDLLLQNDMKIRDLTNYALSVINYEILVKLNNEIDLDLSEYKDDSNFKDELLLLCYYLQNLGFNRLEPDSSNSKLKIYLF